ncbi:hypothetical protein SUGI_0372410 [Cryptomeria japonica]|nr:hypothetical protein SUGI_0372410 [Cryptomeria japonica]
MYIQLNATKATRFFCQLALSFTPGAMTRTQLGSDLYNSDHEEGIFRFLKTNVDLFDDFGRECFVDLALFPENKKICADVLLDIWVYV